MDVFPPRNLPGTSDNWGHHVENRLLGISMNQSELQDTSGNGQRFTGGQLGVFSRQVDDQIARTTLVQHPADLSVTGSGNVEPFPRASRSVTFPNPGGGRAAQVEVYGYHATPNFGSVGFFAYLSFQGKIVSKFIWHFDSDDSPAFDVDGEWCRGLANITLPESGPIELTITVVRTSNVAGTSTETLSNIEVYLTPFQKAA